MQRRELNGSPGPSPAADSIPILWTELAPLPAAGWKLMAILQVRRAEEADVVKRALKWPRLATSPYALVQTALHKGS